MLLHSTHGNRTNFTCYIDADGADMLRHNDIRRKDASVRCLEVLTSSKPQYWKQLLDAGQSHCFFVRTMQLQYTISHNK